MNRGIQVFNPDGSLQFDAQNRLLRLIAITQTGAVNGSANVSALSQGAAVVRVVGSPAGQPVVSAGGNTVSWSYDTVPAEYRSNHDLQIMVY